MAEKRTPPVESNKLILATTLTVSGNKAVYEIDEQKLVGRSYLGQSQSGRVTELGTLLAVKTGGVWFNRRDNRDSWSERITDPKALSLLESYRFADSGSAEGATKTDVNTKSTTKENMAEKSIYLYCTEGGSDKEYHAHLRRAGDGWMVQYANGPRGRVGQSKNKLAAPVSFEEASKAYDALVKSKIKGGYTEAESGVRFTNTEHAHRASGHVQQLPTAVDEGEADALNHDDQWGAQEKANGERRTIEVLGGVVRGINKLGLWVSEFGVARKDDASSAIRDVVFDGEQVGNAYYVFDMLKDGAQDLKGLPFSERYARMEKTLRDCAHLTPSVQLLRCAFTTESKLELLARVEDQNLEGIVYKHKDAFYDAGRSASCLKYKLVESATCIVLAQNAQRSVQLGLLGEDGQIAAVGNVTIPANHAIPAPEDLVEVEYLYYNPGGAFEQPTYLGRRNDILREEARLSQVTRLKPGVSMDGNGSRIARSIERSRG
jgi:bifunctional non-homologous end joining protein LigD